MPTSTRNRSATPRARANPPGPGGARGCSHGWRAPQAGATRGPGEPDVSAPEGAEELPTERIGRPSLCVPGDEIQSGVLPRDYPTPSAMFTCRDQRECRVFCPRHRVENEPPHKKCQACDTSVKRIYISKRTHRRPITRGIDDAVLEPPPPPSPLARVHRLAPDIQPKSPNHPTLTGFEEKRLPPAPAANTRGRRPPSSTQSVRRRRPGVGKPPAPRPATSRRIVRGPSSVQLRRWSPRPIGANVGRSAVRPYQQRTKQRRETSD